MKIRVITIGAVLAVFGVWIWVVRSEQRTARISAERLTAPDTREKSASQAAAPRETTNSHGVDLSEMWRRFEIEIDKRALDAAIATGDPYKWQPILGQVRHFNIPREKSIALLLRYLDHRDPLVRAMVAQYLFMLGSRAGGPVLVAFLKDAAAGGSVGVDLVNAAVVLHQYRYPVDANLIYAAYQKTAQAGLLMYAQLLGSELAIPETRQRLKSHGVMSGGLTPAGIMRLNDPDSMAIYEATFGSDAAWKREKAAAALFRVTGEARYLDYLIAVAEAAVGLRPRNDYLDANSFNGADAIKVLQQTVLPQSTDALRRIEVAARKNRHGVEADRALAGLFYFHQDYDYVDSLIMAQFTGKLPEGLLIGSIWDMASARGKPEIEAAAKAYNPEAYEREFLRKAGRPVESWIFQYLPPEIPSYVRPPFKG